MSNVRRRAYTKEECASMASKYAYRSDFQNNAKGAYIRARNCRWLDEICAHMVPKPFTAKGGVPNVPARNRIDLTGKVFGKWTVLNRAGVGKKFGWVCRCTCGTIKQISSQNLRLGVSTKCKKCSNQISKPMKELHQFIESLGITAILSHKEFGFEIDIYVPDRKFFIEYDGLLWHSTKFKASHSAEKLRRDKFFKLGGSGLRIFEDQYLKNPELIKKMIAHRLGKGSATLPNTVRIEITRKPAQFKQFCNSMHLDGYGKSTWAVIAYNEQNIPLAFMGFRPYMSGKYKGNPELSRFCTNYNFNCYGLFSKMLKIAKNNIKTNNLGTVIVSASDNCISSGAVYKNNGFKQQGSKDVLNWYYYLHSKGLRMHRANGKKLHSPNITPEQYQKYPTESSQISSGITALIKFGKLEPMYKIYGWGQKLWVLQL